MRYGMYVYYYKQVHGLKEWTTEFLGSSIDTPMSVNGASLSVWRVPNEVGPGQWDT